MSITGGRGGEIYEPSDPLPRHGDPFPQTGRPYPFPPPDRVIWAPYPLPGQDDHASFLLPGQSDHTPLPDRVAISPPNKMTLPLPLPQKDQSRRTCEMTNQEWRPTHTVDRSGLELSAGLGRRLWSVYPVMLMQGLSCIRNDQWQYTTHWTLINWHFW